jgi:MFS family permease
VSPPSAIEAPSSEPPLAASSKRLVPWLIAVAFFMESLDTTILNTAVPTIAAALHVAPLSMKSVLASYTLSLAVFIPISGWMANRFGTRRVFASAIGLFTLGSFLCGISSNIHVLVACRIRSNGRMSEIDRQRTPRRDRSTLEMDRTELP